MDIRKGQSCLFIVPLVGLLEYPIFLYRSKKRRKRVQDSSESESEGGEEGVWVEKKIKRDNEDAFVGPVPEIRVQANVNKKEYVPTPWQEFTEWILVTVIFLLLLALVMHCYLVKERQWPLMWRLGREYLVEVRLGSLVTRS